MVLEVNVGVTRVWVGATPMLNLAGAPVMVCPVKEIVIGDAELVMAENVTTSAWHVTPQPLAVTDFTVNPDRGPDGTPALTPSGAEVETVTPVSTPLVAAPNVKPLMVTVCLPAVTPAVPVNVMVLVLPVAIVTAYEASRPV